MKDTNILDIENNSCVRNVMKVTPEFGIERKPWGAACILIKVNNRVYICIFYVKSDEYKCWTKNSFVYDIQFKPLHHLKFCGALNDNRADAPSCVLENKYRETKLNFKYAHK